MSNLNIQSTVQSAAPPNIQSSVQPNIQSTVQSTVQSAALPNTQTNIQSTVQSTVQSNTQNILNFTLTSPSFQSPLVSVFEATGYIIVDINNPPLNQNAELPTQMLNMPGNLTIQNIYPVGSQFTQISGNNNPNQVIVLYDKYNNVLDNIATNYPNVKRIKSYLNIPTPSISGNSDSSSSNFYNPSSSSNNNSTNNNSNNNPNPTPNSRSDSIFSSTQSFLSNNYTYLAIGVGIVFLIGAKLSLGFTPFPDVSLSTRGGRNKYIDYGE
jgi:hypothetical protein